MTHVSGILTNDSSLLKREILKAKVSGIYEIPGGVIFNDTDRGFPFVIGHIARQEVRGLRSKFFNKEKFLVNGKWGIVDYDQTLRKLFLVRDSLGICPIYYYSSDDLFVFSTSLHRLFEFGVCPELNHSLVSDFLLTNKIDHSTDTLLSDVKELQQAECLSINVDTHKWVVYSYYQPRIKEPPGFKLYEEILTRNKEEVLNSVNQIRDHDNQAVFLSGGLDSSVITACLARSENAFISALTVSYPSQPSIDETAWAKLVIDMYPDLDWDCVEAKGDQFILDIENLHKMIEFPTLSAGTYNQYCLFQYCSQNEISQAWDGLGADAVYGGHDHYRHLLFKELLMSLNLTAALEILRWKGGLVNELWSVVKTSIKYLGINKSWINRSLLSYRQDLEFYNPDFIENSRSTIESQSILQIRNLKDLMARDFFGSGVRHLSRFSDRLARGFGVDVHYPFAENVSWAEELFRHSRLLHFNGGKPKAILRDSFKDVLPVKIYSRKDKKGMQSPNNKLISDYKDLWIDYFNSDYGDIYNVPYVKSNYKKWMDVSARQENYKLFKHISFVVWRKILGV